MSNDVDSLFSEHPEFIHPPATTRICRYMSLPSLLDTLQTGRLWFSRTSTLPDLFEGRLPHRNVAKWAPQLVAGYNLLREVTAINCWHMAESQESAAMWSIYCGRDHGVMIESTFETLTHSFVIGGEHREMYKGASVFAGVVHYLNPETEEIPSGPDNTAPNAFRALLWKRKAFDYERELRVVFDPGSWIGPMFGQDAVDGWKVPIDLKRLVTRIVVAPGTPDWYFEVLRRFVGDQFELAFSRLDDDHASGKPRVPTEPGWIRFKGVSRYEK